MKISPDNTMITDMPSVGVPSIVELTFAVNTRYRFTS